MTSVGSCPAKGALVQKDDLLPLLQLVLVMIAYKLPPFPYVLWLNIWLVLLDIRFDPLLPQILLDGVFADVDALRLPDELLAVGELLELIRINRRTISLLVLSETHDDGLGLRTGIFWLSSFLILPTDARDMLAIVAASYMDFPCLSNVRARCLLSHGSGRMLKEKCAVAY